MSLANDKSIFHDAELSLIVPRCPDGLEFPSARDKVAVDIWLRELHEGAERDCCFYGVSLISGTYPRRLSLPIR